MFLPRLITIFMLFFVKMICCEDLDGLQDQISDKSQGIDDELISADRGHSQVELEEGFSALLICPRSSTSKLVEWRKGLDLLTPGQWVSYGVRCRVKVDVLGTLLIENAGFEVAGQFTCRSGPTTHRFLVHVQKSNRRSLDFADIIILRISFTIVVLRVVYVCITHFFGSGHKHEEELDVDFTEDEEVDEDIFEEERNNLYLRLLIGPVEE